MGRWVTSKGRRIYIPDEGEKNPFAKNKTGITRKDVKELTSRRDKVKDANLKTTSITNEEIAQNKKDWDKLKNQTNKDSKTYGYSREEAEQQMATRYNQGEHDTVMMEKDGKYQVAKNRKEADYAEKNGWKTTEMKSEDYQRIKQKASINKDFDLKEKQIAANKAQAQTESGKKETTEQAMTRLQREAKARVESMSAAQILKYAKDNGLRGTKTDTLAQRDDRVATHMYMQEMKKWRKGQLATDRGKKK